MAKKNNPKTKVIPLVLSGDNPEIALQKALENLINPLLIKKIFPNKEQRESHGGAIKPLSFRKGIFYPGKGRYQTELLPNNGNMDYFFDTEVDEQVNIKGLIKGLRKMKEKGLGIRIADFFAFTIKNPNPHIDQIDASGRGRSWEATFLLKETKKNQEFEVRDIVFKQTFWKATSVTVKVF